MKRPILGLLAAASLMFGVVGVAPAQASAPDSATTIATPAHDSDEGHKHSHKHGRGHPSRQHHRGFHDDDHDHDHDDHDGDGRRRRRCEGVVVICLI